MGIGDLDNKNTATDSTGIRVNATPRFATDYLTSHTSDTQKGCTNECGTGSLHKNTDADIDLFSMKGQMLFFRTTMIFI